MNAQQGFNKRAFTSLSILLSGILLPPSGIILHYTDADGFSALRHTMMGVHNFAATIFVIGVVFHIIFNRHALWMYMQRKMAEYSGVKREFILALVLIWGIILFFSLHGLHVRPH